jgi:hypothetical protein
MSTAPRDFSVDTMYQNKRAPTLISARPKILFRWSLLANFLSPDVRMLKDSNDVDVPSSNIWWRRNMLFHPVTKGVINGLCFEEIWSVTDVVSKQEVGPGKENPCLRPPFPYGLCFRAVTYVRHAVVLVVPRTFERSRDRRLRACQDMKDWCTAASASSAREERPSTWEEATTERRENVRWLNANVWSWPSPGLATKKCHEPAETRPNETILFLDVVWWWRLQRWLANRWFIHPSTTWRGW